MADSYSWKLSSASMILSNILVILDELINYLNEVVGRVLIKYCPIKIYFY